MMTKVATVLALGLTIFGSAHAETTNKVPAAVNVVCANSTELVDIYEGRLYFALSYSAGESVEQILQNAIKQLTRVDAQKASEYAARSEALVKQFDSIEKFEKAHPDLKVVGSPESYADSSGTALSPECRLEPAVDGGIHSDRAGLNTDYVPHEWSRASALYKASLVLHLAIYEDIAKSQRAAGPIVRRRTAILLSDQASAMTAEQLSGYLGSK